jgi:ferredoxin
MLFGRMVLVGCQLQGSSFAKIDCRMAYHKPDFCQGLARLQCGNYCLHCGLPTATCPLGILLLHLASALEQLLCNLRNTSHTQVATIFHGAACVWQDIAGTIQLM